MKRIKSFLTIMMATIFALSLVPAGAWAESGVSPTEKGSITISNPAEGETYNAYKILDLASFQDTNVNTGQHATDAYTYVIHKDSAWLNFIKTATIDGTNKYFETPDEYNPVKLSDTDTSADYYIVKPTAAFKNVFVNEPSNSSLDETANSGVKSSSLVQKFAQDALAWAKKTSPYSSSDGSVISPNATGTGPAANTLKLTTDGNAANGTNDKLDLGYYLIDTSTGTLCALDTTNKDVTVFEKNDLPTIVKKVQEDRDLTSASATDDEGDLKSHYQKVNDATVGDTVHYRTDVNVEKGAQAYVLHDRMEAGLTYDPNSLKIWYVPNGGDLTQKVTTGDKAWVELAANAHITLGSTTYKNGAPTQAQFYATAPVATGDTFTVTFDTEFLTFLSDNIGGSEGFSTATSDTTTLVVEYAATLNEKAEVASANTNETWLVYGDVTSTDQETAHKYTDTYTWPVQVFKYTGDIANNPTPLEGAEFELYENEGHTPPTPISHTTDGKYRFIQLKFGDPGYVDADTSPQYMVVGKGTSVVNNDSKQCVDLGTGASHDYREILTSITTGSSGKFTIKGLDEDASSYYLHEVTAPKGYNRLPYDIKVTVSSTSIDNSLGTVSEQGTAPTAAITYANKNSNGTETAYEAPNTVGPGTQNSVPVLNQTGPELPSTGGIGTTIFYVAGTVLVVGAAVMLVAKRRMGSEA